MIFCLCIIIFTFQPYNVDKLDAKQKRPKPTQKKHYPVESPQGITVKRPWTSPTPHEATTKTAFPLPVQKTNVSRKHYIHLKLHPKCLFITSTK